MGSPQAENGYLRISNEIIDALCMFRIPGECRQVLDCVFRKTYGYQKKEDWISNSQIIEMTGLRKGNASRSLSKLITNKIVIQSDNKLRLNKNYKEWISFKSLSKVITGKKNRFVIQIATSVIQSDNKLLSKVRDTKDNKDNTTKDNKENDKRKTFSKINLSEEDFAYISNYYQVPLSFVRSKYDDMVNWCQANGKTYKNYKAALSNFVKKDAVKVRKEANEQSKITVVRPDPSW